MTGPADRLPESWGSALIALRLSTPRETVVDAAELGALLVLVEAADRHAEPHPDAAAVDALDERSRLVLEALADAGSARVAASALGMHHSSVQARLDALTGQLGYDPRSPFGRTRFELARALAALHRPGLA